MNVHVPQARDQKLAGGIDNAGAGRNLNTLADPGYAPVGDADRSVGAGRRASCVDDGGVLENNRLGRSRGNEGAESEQAGEQVSSTLLIQF